MAGTVEGGRGAAATNKSYYGEDFYARIGALGGSKSRTGGFYANRELASHAGRIGGLLSRRSKNGIRRKGPTKHSKAVQKAYDELRMVQQKAQLERQRKESKRSLSPYMA